MIKEKVIFPITRDIIEGGQHLTRSLYENDIVKCVCCGNPILIDYRSTHLANDEMEMVDCPSCRRHVSVLYYFDRVTNCKRDPIKVSWHSGQRLRNRGL